MPEILEDELVAASGRLADLLTLGAHCKARGVPRKLLEEAQEIGQSLKVWVSAEDPPSPLTTARLIRECNRIEVAIADAIEVPGISGLESGNSLRSFLL